MNVVTQIGHNNPPEETPFDIASRQIDDLYLEATNWADGVEVTTQDGADDLNRLINGLRDARKYADEARKAEKKPHDDAGKEIQQRYKPLLEKVDRAKKSLKAVLTPYLQKLEQEKIEKERLEREKADLARQEAEEAIRASQPTDLAAREEAESLIIKAKEQQKIADSVSKQKTLAQGGGRATGLRTKRVVEVSDYRALASHIWSQDFPALAEFLDNYAAQKVRTGALSLPGCEITEERVA